jgi:virulence-associated protein VagC
MHGKDGGKRVTAKVFMTERSQVVRIPKEYRFGSDEVLLGFTMR